MGHRAQERSDRPKEPEGSHPPPQHRLYPDAARSERYKVPRATRPRRTHSTDPANNRRFAKLSHRGSAGEGKLAPAAIAHVFGAAALRGLRLWMWPLSVPAVGSITALISAALPDASASLTALVRLGVSAQCCPAPPNASMIFS